MSLKSLCIWCCVAAFCMFAVSSESFAAYVTMAHFDINGDGQKEIVRTEGLGDTTTIKVYEGIEGSYFYRPSHQLSVPGRIVQVPEVADFTNDGVLDLYFATGADIGVVYYDTVEQEYKRMNEIVASSDSAVAINSDYSMRKQEMSKDESALLLKMEKGVTAEGEGARQMNARKDYSKIQTV